MSLTIQDKIYKFKFGGDARRMFYQSFYDYLKQGVPISNIIKMLSDSIVKANSRNQLFLAKILDDLAMQMATGVDFAEALAKWVPINEVMSIRAGMKSGDPAAGMKNTIDALAASATMGKEMASKLSYPAILLVALFGLIYFFSVAIIPKVADVMDPADWPQTAKNMYDMAFFVQHYWWAIIVGIVSFVVFIKSTLDRVTGKVRSLMDRIPPYSFYRSFHGANLLVSLSSLMMSGIPFVEALRQSRQLASPYLVWHLDKVIANMSDGKSLGEAFDTGLFTNEMMVNIYMMSSNADFQQAIKILGHQAIEKGIEKIGSISSMINGIVLLGVASYIGWVYISLFMVTNAVGQSVQ